MFLFRYVDYNQRRKELFVCAAPDILVADKMFKIRTGTNPDTPNIARVISPTDLPEGTEIAVLPKVPEFLSGAKERKILRKLEEDRVTEYAGRLIVAWREYVKSAAKTGLNLCDRCFYCGIQCEKLVTIPPHPPNGKTLDHVHPKSRGGMQRVVACNQCNNRKSNLNIEEFRVALLGSSNAEFFAEYLMRTDKDDYVGPNFGLFTQDGGIGVICLHGRS